jgi:hypothetical protein
MTIAAPDAVRPVPAVILAGGSEIVALAVAEALVPRGIPLVVIGMGKPSLIRDVQPGMIYRQIRWPPQCKESAIEELIAVLDELGAGRPLPWPVFATEDGGLRLLLEEKLLLGRYLAIPPGSPHLKLGGLDKAELFQFLQAARLEGFLAPTHIVRDLVTAKLVPVQLGGAAVFKPALRPLSMTLDDWTAKAIVADSGRDEAMWSDQLARVWSASSRWVAQTLLLTPPEGEASWWGIRTADGELFGVSVYQRWKHPRIGGTAGLVEMVKIPELDHRVAEILRALQFRGIVEMEFLQDLDGNWRLLEINLRPWLQIALAEQARLPLLFMAYLDLIDEKITVSDYIPTNIYWVNAERMLLAAWSGAYGPRLKALWRTSQLIYHSDYKAIYSTPFPRVRARWLGRMAKRAIGW